MATKLQCEICGGKLIGKPGGIFECENCGTEYSAEWAKAKIQEITGTVKVEGTVEVTGKVQIEGPVKIENGGPNEDSLLKRGNMMLEDLNWKEASDYFNQVLNINPESASAYLGLALAECRLKNIQELADPYGIKGDELIRIRILRDGRDPAALIRTVREAAKLGFREAQSQIKRMPFSIEVTDKQIQYLQKNGVVFEYEKGRNASGVTVADVENNSNYKKYIRFAKTSEIEIKVAHLREARQRELASAEALMQQNTLEGYEAAEKLLSSFPNDRNGREMLTVCQEKKKQIIEKKREQAVKARKRFTFFKYSRFIGIKTDGMLITADEYLMKYFPTIMEWNDLAAVSGNGDNLVGLREDGTVVAEVFGRYYNDYGQDKVTTWRNITEIATGWKHTVGLKADGTVVAVGSNERGQCNVAEWKDVVSIAAGIDYTKGLKADGTIISTNNNGSQDDFKNIVQIIDSNSGLKADGTVITMRDDYEKTVEQWSGIVAIEESISHLVGLRADGTVVAVHEEDPEYYDDCGQCDVTDWKEIIAVAAGSKYTIGLKADGTFVTAGDAPTIGDIRLFNDIETLDEEIKTAVELRKQRQRQEREEEYRKKAEQEKMQKIEELRQRIAEAERKKQTAEAELRNLKGLFTGKRRKELEEEIAAAERQIAWREKDLENIQ